MKVNVPTQWSDVSLEQYQAISLLDKAAYSSDLRFTSDVIQILCDINNVQELPLNVVGEISKHINFLGDEVTKERLTSFKHNGKSYEWIGNFNEVTVGEQLSIEQTIDIEELTINESFDVVCAVLLREDGKPFDSNNFEENRELFRSFPVTKVIGMILFFFEWRAATYRNYGNLFNSTKIDEDEYTEEELAIEAAIQKDSNVFKWVAMVDKLSNSDITKQDEVFKINYIQALNTLSFWKHNDEQKQKSK